MHTSSPTSHLKALSACNPARCFRFNPRRDASRNVVCNAEDTVVRNPHRRHVLASSAAVTMAGVLTSIAPAAALDLPWREMAGSQTPAAPASDRRLQPQLASALTSSVWDALLQESKGLSKDDLQLEIYRLREREWPYYRNAQQGQATLPALPDLSDASGGLSNPVFFNFISYILWKVAARHVAGEEGRRAVNLRAGQLLAERALQRPLALVAAAAAAGSNGRADPRQMQEAIGAALDIMQSGGYVADYRVVWGGTPALPDRPYGEPALEPDAVDLEQDVGLTEFQVTLRAPADILGSVSLRGEEDGWFGHAASSALAAILSAGGWQCGLPDEFFFQDEWRGPTSVQDRVLLLLGDPLQSVGVPWEPTSLIQDWRLS